MNYNFVSVFIVFFLSIRYIPQIICDIKNRRREILIKKFSITKAWHFWLLYIVILIGFMLNSSNHNTKLFLTLISLIIFLTGFILGLLGLITLNKYKCWNEELVIYKNCPELVNKNIYRYLKHPMRIGIIMELLGIIIIGNTLWLWYLYILIILLYFIRTKDENELLSNFFGKN